ncbi:hypothetical protein V1478_018816 [Vespula squamosa]|uniref:Uncharacterized protein n=1 Tax=Vespula squamosa TaxID=30214 RepID=A0ABD1ZTW1_VESSQ
MDLSRREVRSPLANFVTRKLSELRDGKFSGKNIRKGKAEDRNKEIFDQEFHALCVFRPARYAKIVQYYPCPFKVSRDLGEYHYERAKESMGAKLW